MKTILYDSTLREGMQSAGVSFTLPDKLKLITLLDDLGVRYIEAGNPGASLNDAKLYQLMQLRPLKNAKLTAFGSTCRVGIAPEDDYNINALINANTPAVCIFGKSNEFHVHKVLNCTNEENLTIIYDTISYLVRHDKEVIFDAEHFFDGCAVNPAYALQTLQTAQSAGASWICLCDTNGGTMTRDLSKYTQMAKNALDVPLGIHCHNDAGLADANSLEAVLCGASMVQATLCGWGERCGNANLFTIIPDLQLKLGYDCISPMQMRALVSTCQIACEITNQTPPKVSPYVGRTAFMHKAGMHIDAVNKDPATFEHIHPDIVGAKRQLLLSEVSGRGAVLQRVREVVPEMTKDSPFVADVVDKLKQLEGEGFMFESAHASFTLMVRRMLGLHVPAFDVVEFKVIASRPSELNHTATAMIRVHVGGVEEITAADGDGPVNALDLAVRKALERFYPQLHDMKLTDYKVRVLDSRDTTASRVRVIIESTDEKSVWTTVGVHEDVLQASFMALVDSLEYKLTLG